MGITVDQVRQIPDQQPPRTDGGAVTPNHPDAGKSAAKTPSGNRRQQQPVNGQKENGQSEQTSA